MIWGYACIAFVILIASFIISNAIERGLSQIKYAIYDVGKKLSKGTD